MWLNLAVFKFAIKDTPHSIPSNWEDVCFEDAIKVFTEENFKEYLLNKAGITSDILKKMSLKSAKVLFTILEFTNDLTIFSNNTPSEKYKDFQYGNLTYGDDLSIKKVFKAREKEPAYNSMAEVYEIITKEKINNKPVTEVIGDVNFFLSNLIISIIDISDLMKALPHLNKNRQILQDLKSLEVLPQL